MQIEPLRFSADEQLIPAQREMLPVDSANGLRGDLDLASLATSGGGMIESAHPLNDLPESETSNHSAGKPAKSRGTFELKFLVEEGHAQKIIEWARLNLDPDPNFDPEFGDGYRVNSLYLDTAQFDVFHRADGFRQQKYRLRRYGRESLIWFEQKRKRKGLVRKKRVSVMETDTPTRLVHAPQEDWEGHWFRHKIDSQGLQPVCQVTYQRFARMKSTDEGIVRLTIDDRLMGSLAEGWKVPTVHHEGIPLLEGRRVLELKFRGAMPGLFRRLIEDEQLQVTSFSKYRTSVQECVPLDSFSGDTAQGSDDA